MGDTERPRYTGFRGLSVRGITALQCIKGSPVLNNHLSGLPRSGKNIWKMKFFPDQGKVREFCGWPGKFSKDLDSQEKVGEFENICKWLWQTVFREFIYSVQEGKGCTF